MAGESAEAMARRHREHAQRFHESARRWQQGAEGEKTTARALADLPRGWVVLHDLAWPGRARANVDHVVVGPPGVIAVDSKNWSGRITVGPDGLRQNGRDRSAAVWGVESAAHAIADALPFLARGQTRAVMCMVGQGTLSGFVGSVLVTSDTELVADLLARPAILGPREVWEHAEAVRARLGAAATTDWQSQPRPRVAQQRPPEVSARRTVPPPARVRSSGSSRKRAGRPRARRAPAGLGKGLFGLAFLGALVVQPGLVQDAADEIARRFTQLMEPAAVTPAPDTPRTPGPGAREGSRDERTDPPGGKATEPARARDEGG